MGRKLILGLGTGRCGTTSLGRFLNAQSGIQILHEGRVNDGQERPLRWHDDHANLLRWLAALEEQAEASEYYGDIGMYFLPYAEFLIERFPDVKLVCLKRHREEVVKSYLGWVKEYHHWFDHDGGIWKKHTLWDSAFPKFDEPDKAKAIGLYWDSYYAEVDRLIRLYPDHIACFPMQYMNTSEGQQAILDFIGYTRVRRLSGKYRANKRHSKLVSSLSTTSVRLLERAMVIGRQVFPKSIRDFLWVAWISKLHRFLLGSQK